MQVVPLRQLNNGTAKWDRKPSLWFGLVDLCTCMFMGSLLQFTRTTNPWWPSLANPSSKPPARIERWSVILQPYQIIVKFRRGWNKPSRLPVTASDNESNPNNTSAESYRGVYQLPSDYLTPKALKTQDIEAAAQADSTLQGVTEAVAKGNWHLVVKRVDLAKFWLLERVKEELAMNASGNLILCGACIVIPQSLQEHVINLVHEGCQGLVRKSGSWTSISW